MTLIRLFYRPQYTSEVTVFLNKLKVEDPALERAQSEGRARLWDRHLDGDLLGEFAAAAVAQKPYVYMTGQGDLDD